jgi:hypothetical protein
MPLTTLADYRAAYESLRRRALIAARYVELGPKRPRGRRDWEHEGKRLALQTAHDLYWLSVKVGSIAWNRRRVGAEPEALRHEIEATRAELLAATRPLDAIEAALGPYSHGRADAGRHAGRLSLRPARAPPRTVRCLR